MFVDALMEGLMVLGESPRDSLLQFLQKNYGLRREDIAKKPEVFSQALEKIFGRGGSVLEAIVIKKLYEKLGTPFQRRTGASFSQYLVRARRKTSTK